MPVDTAKAGKTYEPATFEVEADRIRQYAEAVHEDNSVYHDAEAAKQAGFRDLVAPPMFAVVYSAPAMGPAILDTIGDALPRMVHGGQEFVWSEPVCAGDTITTEPVSSVYESGSRRRLFQDGSLRTDATQRHQIKT